MIPSTRENHENRKAENPMRPRCPLTADACAPLPTRGQRALTVQSAARPTRVQAGDSGGWDRVMMECLGRGGAVSRVLGEHLLHFHVHRGAGRTLRSLVFLTVQWEAQRPWSVTGSAHERPCRSGPPLQSLLVPPGGSGPEWTERLGGPGPALLEL